MKVTQKLFNPIQIVLETPEEVQTVLLALNKYAQTETILELRNLANTLHNEIAQRYKGNI